MPEQEGWVKLHRKLLDSTVFTNPNLLKVWIWCLLKASHKEHKERIGLQEVVLSAGQFVFGRKKAALELDMKENMVYRIVKQLEKDGFLNIKSNNKFSVVTIVKWEVCQSDSDILDSKMNNKSTTNQQQIDTNKNEKNEKNEKNKKNKKNKDIKSIVEHERTAPDKSADKKESSNLGTIKVIIDHLNNKAQKNFNYKAKGHQRHIIDRLNEGYTVEQFCKVIDIKVAEWNHEPVAGKRDMRVYVRPETLFGTKFDAYLNQAKAIPGNQTEVHTNQKPNKFHNFEQRTYDFADLEQRFINKANGITENGTNSG